jgi:hypothetical protein
MSKFWIYDPSVILDKNKYWQIIPTYDMKLTEQLNTISRFLIYLIILLILFKRDSVLLLLAIVAIIIIIIYYSLYVNDINSVKLDINENFNDELNEYVSQKKNITSPIDAVDIINANNANNAINAINAVDTINNTALPTPSYAPTTPSLPITPTPIPPTTLLGSNINGLRGIDAIDLQTAYIDSNGDYVFGDFKKDSNINGGIKNGGGINGGIKNGGGINGGGINDGTLEDNVISTQPIGLTYKMNDKFIDSTCRKPTADNPYANIVFSDYLDAGNVASPCNVDDEELPKKSLELYNSTIFRNVDDVFERENSQRLFYTLPVNTIPNKQTEFARWLYDTGPRCKEDTSKCTYYEDPSMTSPRYL